MNILIYAINYAPEPTGSGKYTAEMAEWLAARGNFVSVITGLPHYPQWYVPKEYKIKKIKKYCLNGVTVTRVPHYVPSADRLNGKRRILLELSFNLGSLITWFPYFFMKNKFDIVISISPPLELAIYPLVYSNIRRVPMLLHIQDLQVDAAFRLKLIKENRLSRVLFNIENYLLKKATKVSSISNAMLKRLMQKGVQEDKLIFLPNWSDLQFIYPKNRFNYFRRDILNVKDDEILIMYSGNIGEKQGLDIILYAAKRLQERRELRFAIIGDGVAKKRLLSLANYLDLNNLFFMPVQPIETLPDLLAAADIHLVIQKPEASDLVMPSKLTNILAAGRPCIATALPGSELYEVIKSHKTGLISQPYDIESLVHAILCLVDDPKLREEFSINARKYAEQFLDKETILTCFETELYKLVTRKKRGMN